MKKLLRPITLTIKELKLVEWISFKQTVRYTLLVLVISFFIGIIIVVFDTILFRGRNIILEL
ncbi:preprotein translocase subunit SecE [Candidatus Dojkabacteria bacterium]|nr:preprotein translocase subunit SecE [Candidatus Dojkabacteria bacterium]